MDNQMNESTMRSNNRPSDEYTWQYDWTIDHTWQWNRTIGHKMSLSDEPS